MSEVTADGRPVGLYEVLPDGGDPAFLHSKVPPGAAILDLSHSGGRFANPLAGLGHPMVVVDDSAAMLAQVRDARTVQADLGGLDLGERFPVVLAANTRTNAVDVTLRDELLAACRRHVTPDGLVVLRWLPPSWFDTAVTFTGRLKRMEITFEIESFDGTVLDSRSTYRLGRTAWEQRNSARRLSNADMRAALVAAGLRFDRHLRGGRQFFSAVPVSDPPEA
ncbi:class I SAM-dependent methyltransferase [Dactylosporangium sp. NPDC049742]|uniref:class I SAM-dependent methyltransferase n=1 Tax=Dactylosporangium sp. NPDC049742 TaxID=3154737 RepID=UPI003417F5C2